MAGLLEGPLHAMYPLRAIYPLPVTHDPLRATRHARPATRYTLHATRYTLHATRCTLHAARYALHATRYTLHATRYALRATFPTLRTSTCYPLTATRYPLRVAACRYPSRITILPPTQYLRGYQLPSPTLTSILVYIIYTPYTCTRLQMKVRTLLHWGKTLYMLLSFPFVVLKIPGLNKILTHAVETGTGLVLEIGSSGVLID